MLSSKKNHVNWFEWCTNFQDCNQLGALKIIVINMTCPVEISHKIRVSICVSVVIRLE